MVEFEYLTNSVSANYIDGNFKYTKMYPLETDPDIVKPDFEEEAKNAYITALKSYIKKLDE